MFQSFVQKCRRGHTDCPERSWHLYTYTETPNPTQLRAEEDDKNVRKQTATSPQYRFTESSERVNVAHPSTEECSEPWIDFIRRSTHRDDHLMNFNDIETWVVKQRLNIWRYANTLAKPEASRWTQLPNWHLVEWTPQGSFCLEFGFPPAMQRFCSWQAEARSGAIRSRAPRATAQRGRGQSSDHAKFIEAINAALHADRSDEVTDGG